MAVRSWSASWTSGWAVLSAGGRSMFVPSTTAPVCRPLRNTIHVASMAVPSWPETLARQMPARPRARRARKRSVRPARRTTPLSAVPRERRRIVPRRPRARSVAVLPRKRPSNQTERLPLSQT
jgi:hypothetical protein